MPVKRGRSFAASFDEVFPQVQAHARRLVDAATDGGKPSAASGSGNVLTPGEQKAA